jgi:hypothetical protein
LTDEKSRNPLLALVWLNTSRTKTSKKQDLKVLLRLKLRQKKAQETWVFFIRNWGKSKITRLESFLIGNEA